MASLSGGQNCLRVLTIIFNFVVFGCGLVLLGFSSYALYTLNTTLKDMKPQEYGVIVGFIVLSFIIFFLGFLGCCGAWKENVCMLTTFAVVISILLVLEIAIAIVGFIYKEKLPAIIEEFMQIELGNAKAGSSPTMDNIQTMFKCCGMSGPADYRGYGLPPSCQSYNDGCLTKVDNFIIKHSTTLLIVAIVVAVLQLAAVIVACCLRSSIRSYQAV